MKILISRKKFERILREFSEDRFEAKSQIRKFDNKLSDPVLLKTLKRSLSTRKSSAAKLLERNEQPVWVHFAALYTKIDNVNYDFICKQYYHKYWGENISTVEIKKGNEKIGNIIVDTDAFLSDINPFIYKSQS